MTVRYIRITAVPEGAAPKWVREKWLGLELPLVIKQKKTRKFFTRSVLENPDGLFGALRRILTGKSEKQDGYAVATLAAIAVLEKADVDAAAWWKQNTPQLLKPGQFFVFKSDCCYLMEEKRGL